MTDPVLLAPDAFKGTFTATEVAVALARGVRAAGGLADLCPIADGGEGTAAVFASVLGGERREAIVRDPIGRPRRASWWLLRGGTAAIDLAEAAGLPLLAQLAPERADTFGVGELIVAAVAAGAGRVVVAPGGSASTDGGRGAIEAIRWHGGLGGAGLEVLCDVSTRYEDAARVFGPQKGAGPDLVERLSERLDAFADTLPRDPRGVPMSGCGGGLSGGLWAAFDAELSRGPERVFELLALPERVSESRFVISGEGRFDAQSFEGKAVGALAALCAEKDRELHVIAGSLGPVVGPSGAIASVAAASTLREIESAAARRSEHNPKLARLRPGSRSP